jgi:putative oxidoreductase
LFDNILKHADLPARAGMSAIFILSGASKIGGFAATQGYMEAFGLPGVLLAPTIAFEIGAGAALLLGLGTRFAALLLAGFSLVTALVFHRDFADQIQQIMFLKNVAIAGGLLLFAKTGAPGLSLDAFRAQRAGA